MSCIANYIETVWVRANLGMPVVCVICGIPISAALLLVSAITPLWPITVLYLLWMYTIDRKTCTTGGRQNLPLRKYAYLPQHTKHLPLIYEREPETVLDPKKNYLFCCFPHSHTPYGICAAFNSCNTEFSKWFPDHTQRTSTLPIFFNIPFYREYYYESGMISTSEQSLSHLLADPHGGNIVGLTVGGSAEVQYAGLKNYHIVLKNRRGFVKIALKNGSPIVPVLSFGAENIYKQVTIPFFKSVQNWIRDKTSILIFFYNGQGCFQKRFGLVPHFCPVWTIVGKPIEVQKTGDPTDEDIEQLHQRFVNDLTELFNKYKRKCLADPDNTQLIIH